VKLRQLSHLDRVSPKYTSGAQGTTLLRETTTAISVTERIMAPKMWSSTVAQGGRHRSLGPTECLEILRSVLCESTPVYREIPSKVKSSTRLALLEVSHRNLYKY
jgi:hypothetical protein